VNPKYFFYTIKNAGYAEKDSYIKDLQDLVDQNIDKYNSLRSNGSITVPQEAKKEVHNESEQQPKGNGNNKLLGIHTNHYVKGENGEKFELLKNYEPKESGIAYAMLGGQSTEYYKENKSVFDQAYADSGVPMKYFKWFQHLAFAETRYNKHLKAIGTNVPA
jgi:hypothetical protein